MGADTSIEWAGCTFNPWVGCTRVSDACAHCYAETWARRTGHPELWQGERRRTTDANWRQPLKWNEKAKAEGRHWRVFCASLADVFDNQVPIEWLADLFEIIDATPNLDWLLLTKRPQNIVKRLHEAHAAARDRISGVWSWIDLWLAGDAPDNVWLGTTVENQEEADRRIPALLDAPARVHFLSCEPLLGEVDITEWLWPVEPCPNCPCPDPLRDRSRIEDCCRDPSVSETKIGWIICGGESGVGARRFEIDWARDLEAQCRRASVPFFMKQLGSKPTLHAFTGMPLRDSKGGDWTEWPEDLQVREFPR